MKGFKINFEKLKIGSILLNVTANNRKGRVFLFKPIYFAYFVLYLHLLQRDVNRVSVKLI